MSSKTASKLVLPVSERDHIRGPVQAPVTLVEYGDFECPYCGQAYVVVKELEQELASLLRVVFRNFPLTMVHPHALQAAETAESAGGQGRFWDMHDVLFEHQDALSVTDLTEYANDLGLDMTQFVRDVTEHTYADRIREEAAEGVRSGVNGTPTFFINGVRYEGSSDFGSLLAVIQDEGAR
ncbi:DsbA family protein [Nitrospira sp. Nam74]